MGGPSQSRTCCPNGCREVTSPLGALVSDEKHYGCQAWSGSSLGPSVKWSQQRRQRGCISG